MPIKVIHPITRLIVGGAQENTLFTAERLDKNRFSVDVIAGPQTGSEGSLIEEAYQRGISLKILPELVRELNFKKDVAAFKSLSTLFNKNRYQIVHTHSSKAGILGRFAARAACIPLIIHTIHGWSFHEHMPASTRIIYILLEKISARFSSALVCVSNQDIRKGLEKGIGRVDQYHLIRSAIPLEDFSPERFDRNAIRLELGFSAKDQVIGYIGRFSEQKDPLAWIRTAQMVASQQANVKFLMVGDGPLRPQVESALQQANLSDRTKLLGLRRDIPRMMSAIDLLLLTSRWEGLPRTIPQAMALGIPVVAFQTDGIEEAILPHRTGYLVKPGDWQELTAACGKLVQQPALRQAFGLQAQVLARKEFDLGQMIVKITNLYEMLLQDLSQRTE